MRVKQLKSLVLFLAIAMAYTVDIYSMPADTLFIINVNTDSAIEYKYPTLFDAMEEPDILAYSLETGEYVFYGGEQSMFISIVMRLYPLTLQDSPKRFRDVEMRGVRREIEYMEARSFHL